MSLSLTVKTELIEVDKANKEDYVLFDTPNEVYFISNLSCLIDYSSLVNMDINDIIYYKSKGLKVPLLEDLGNQNRPIDSIHPNGFMKTIKRS